MTKRSILSLACKVFGVIFLAETVAAIPRVINYSLTFVHERVMSQVNPTGYVLLDAGSIVLGFAIAYVLIGSSDWIARTLVPEDQDVPLSDLVTKGRAALEPACKIVGIVLIAQAIPEIVRTVSDYALGARLIREASGSDLGDAFRVSMGRLWAERSATLIASGVTIAIGLCLIFLAGRLTACLYRTPAGAGQERLPDPG
jgi:hypothetical protein